MRILYSAGQTAARGTYWDPATGHRLDLDTEGVLPGDKEERYLKMPIGGMLPIGIIVGFLYVLLLPIIGIATFLFMYIVPIFGFASGVLVVGGKAVGAFLEMLGRSVSFDWRPSNAYLSGKKKRRVTPLKAGKGGKEDPR